MSEATGVLDDEIADSAGTRPRPPGQPERMRLLLRRHGRRILYSYAVVLLLVTSFQAVCILLLLRQTEGWAQSWTSFGRAFATSPAAAGICAVIAAGLGARQLSRQLTQSKKKAAEDAWWQQFEWVTDRIISSGQKGDKDDTRLPASLAFDLLNSLSRSATEAFQEAAVAGILTHYLKDFRKKQPTPDQDEMATSNGATTKPSGGPAMDPEDAESLRNLIDELPESSRAPARTVLRAYENDYEQEVVKALRHVFDDAVHTDDLATLGADAIIEVGDQKIAVEVMQSVRDLRAADLAIRHLQQAMGRENASKGVIITSRTAVNMNAIYRSLPAKMIHLIVWEPSMGSFALRKSVGRVLGGAVKASANAGE